MVAHVKRPLEKSRAFNNALGGGSGVYPVPGNSLKAPEISQKRTILLKTKYANVRILIVSI